MTEIIKTTTRRGRKNDFDPQKSPFMHTMSRILGSYRFSQPQVYLIYDEGSATVINPRHSAQFPQPSNHEDGLSPSDRSHNIFDEEGLNRESRSSRALAQHLSTKLLFYISSYCRFQPIFQVTSILAVHTQQLHRPCRQTSCPAHRR